MKKQLLFLLAFTAGASAVYAQSGNVGIGTTTPEAKLDVKTTGSSTDTTRALQARNATDAPLFTVLNNGYVGVGMTNPAVNFHVRGLSGLVSRMRLNSPDDNTSMFFVANSLAGAVVSSNQSTTLASSKDIMISAGGADPGAGIIFNTSGFERMRILAGSGGVSPTRGTVGINTFYDTDTLVKLHVSGGVRLQGLPSSATTDSVLAVDGSGYVRTIPTANLGIGTAWALSGNSLTGSEILGSTNAQPLRIITDSTERIRVTETGNVGIGTSTPQTKLQIQNDAIGDNALAIGGAAPSIRFYGGDTLPNVGPATYDVPYAKIGLATDTGQFANSTVPGDLVIQTVDTNKSIIFSNLFGGGNGAEQMRLNGNGNLGIGTATPVAKLHVAGNVRIVDGTQGAGKVLTSDANGLASWVTPGQSTYNQGSNTFGLLVNANFSAAGPVPAEGTNYLFDAASVNVGSAYNTTTGVFTAPADGIYNINAAINHAFEKNIAQSDFATAYFYPQLKITNAANDSILIKGSAAEMLNGKLVPGGIVYSPSVVNTTIALKAGDKVEVVKNSYGSASVGTVQVHPARMSGLIINRIQ